MRSILFVLSLAMAVPALSTTAALADGHSCNQLRQTVINRVPATLHNLPYAALPCSAISELHLLLITRGHDSNLSDRVEAVFRREGLIQ